jgi:protease I
MRFADGRQGSAVELQNLAGKKIAVFVENKFIPEEIEAYRNAFRVLGAEVEFASRISYGDYKPESTWFYSDVDPLDDQPWETPHRLAVGRDVTHVDAHLDEYAAIIMSANYTSVRLRWDNLPTPALNMLTPADIAAFDPREYVKQPPVVKLFAKAMENKTIVKGALCHGLWVLTPNPNLLSGRTVTCHSVVMADVLNAGAHVVLAADGVVVDEDLVTGFSKHEVLHFVQAVAGRICALSAQRGLTQL